MLTPRELATVLAALRHWLQTQGALHPEDLRVAWPQFADQQPLPWPGIEGLCIRLNEGCDCEVSGTYYCGIPGILARIDDCRFVPASVERCDDCERFPSDSAARQHLVDLGFLPAAD